MLLNLYVIVIIIYCKPLSTIRYEPNHQYPVSDGEDDLDDFWEEKQLGFRWATYDHCAVSLRLSPQLWLAAGTTLEWVFTKSIQRLIDQNWTN